MRIGGYRLGGIRLGGEDEYLDYGVLGEAFAPILLDVSVVGRRVVKGSAIASILLDSTVTGTSVRRGRIVAPINLAVEAELERRRLRLEDVRFYFDSSQGFIPTIGGLPVFARASSGISVDMHNRTHEALPNTPQTVWRQIDEDGWNRPLILLQPAHMVDLELQAIDLMYFTEAPSPGEHVFYLRHRVNYNIATTGHLLTIGSLVNGTPRVSIWHQVGGYFAQYHNGVGSTALNIDVSPSVGQIVEMAFAIMSSNVRLQVAIDKGAVLATVGSLPSGGLPVAWADDLVILNGYNFSPTEAEYAEVKILDVGGFGSVDRITEAREFRLSPTGDVL